MIFLNFHTNKQAIFYFFFYRQALIYDHKAHSTRAGSFFYLLKLLILMMALQIQARWLIIMCTDEMKAWKQSSLICFLSRASCSESQLQEDFVLDAVEEQWMERGGSSCPVWQRQQLIGGLIDLLVNDLNITLPPSYTPQIETQAHS